MTVATRTHIGLVRKTNQDAIIAQPGQFPLYGVADGMGGHQAGDVASKTAALMLTRYLENEEPSEDALREAFQRVNELIFDQQQLDSALSGMGTTLTVLWALDDALLLGHVGDSRAYRMRRGALAQVSQDHSLVGELVRAGELTREAAKKHPYRNIITRAIGTSRQVEVDVTRFDAQRGDRWLVCSDGLTEHVDDQKLTAALATLPCEDAADALLHEALSAGARDNVTLVILEVGA